MKHLKILLVFSFLSSSSAVKAQDIVDSAQYLTTKFNKVRGRSDVESHQIIKIEEKNGKQIYHIEGGYLINTVIKIGDSIFCVYNKDTILYYNYALKENNQFLFKFPQSSLETMTVDSIRFKTLQDGKSYKHWYLSSQNFGQIVWVAGLGTENKGWVPYNNYAVYILKAICKNTQLIFWNDMHNGFEPYTVSPSCDFESFKNFNAIKTLESSALNIFPNPTSNFIEIPEIENSHFKIFNSTGSEIIKGNTSGQINVATLPKGIYSIVLTHQNCIFTGKFQKE